MPSIRIPSTRNWKGIYPNENTGDIVRSSNIDISRRPGKVTLSPIFKKVFTDTSDTNFQRIESFVRISTAGGVGVRVYGIGFANDTVAAELWRSGSGAINTGWQEDTHTTGTPPTSFRDMVQDNRFLGRVLITTDTELRRYDGATWDANLTGAAALDSGFPHPIDVFERLAIYASSWRVHTKGDTDLITAEKLSFQAEGFNVYHIFHTPTDVWFLLYSPIGTKNGAIARWDAFSPTYNKIYDIGDRFALSGVNYNGIPIILTNRGRFLHFNGEGFSTILSPTGEELSLPFSTEETNWIEHGGFNQEGVISSWSAHIARRGMQVKGKKILINVGNSQSPSINHTAGIWVLDPIDRTLHKQYSIGNISFGDGFSDSSVAPGAIFVLSDTDEIALVSGSAYNTYDSTTIIGLWSFGDRDTETRGSMELRVIDQPEPQAIWETIWLKHERMRDTDSRLIVKARTEERMRDSDNLPLRGTISFTTNTQFTLTLGTNSDSLVVNDEVEILAGRNAGILSHITAISGAHGASQTITVDETLDDSTGSALAQFNRFIKLTEDTTGEDFYSKFIVPAASKNSPFLQPKVEMRGEPNDIFIENVDVVWESSRRRK